MFVITQKSVFIIKFIYEPHILIDKICIISFHSFQSYSCFSVNFGLNKIIHYFKNVQKHWSNPTTWLYKMGNWGHRRERKDLLGVIWWVSDSINPLIQSFNSLASYPPSSSEYTQLKCDMLGDMDGGFRWPLSSSEGHDSEEGSRKYDWGQYRVFRSRWNPQQSAQRLQTWARELHLISRV